MSIKLATDEMQWKRIVQNDLESMPMAFVVFWGCIVAGGNQTLTSLLLVLYTAARISHTVTFAYQMPLTRMCSWIAGLACILGAGINGTIAAFTS
jgi:glutathione S-transferase